MNLAEKFAEHKRTWAAMVPTAAVARHPYGFLIIRLDSSIEKAEVRFNVWLKHDRVEQQPNWPIHSHEVAMSSYVMQGALENINWPEPRIGFGDPLYLASYTKTSSILTRSELRVTEGRPFSEMVQAGTQYEVAKGMFHATQIPDDAGCTTLCVFHAEEWGTGTVLGRDGHAPRIEFHRFAVAPESADAARRQVLSALT